MPNTQRSVTTTDINELRRNINYLRKLLKRARQELDGKPLTYVTDGGDERRSLAFTVYRDLDQEYRNAVKDLAFLTEGKSKSKPDAGSPLLVMRGELGRRAI